MWKKIRSIELKWATLLLLLILVLLPIFVESSPKLDENAKERITLKVFGSKGKEFVAWKTEDAVKFAFEQMVASIRYLFAATGIGLAFIGKLVVEPRATGATSNLPQGAQYGLLFAGVFWVGSLSCGMIAHFQLSDLAVVETFSIFGSLAMMVLFQLIYFSLGLLCFLFALIRSI